MNPTIKMWKNRLSSVLKLKNEPSITTSANKKPKVLLTYLKDYPFASQAIISAAIISLMLICDPLVMYSMWIGLILIIALWIRLIILMFKSSDYDSTDIGFLGGFIGFIVTGGCVLGWCALFNLVKVPVGIVEEHIEISRCYARAVKYQLTENNLHYIDYHTHQGIVGSCFKKPSDHYLLIEKLQ